MIEYKGELKDGWPRPRYGTIVGSRGRRPRKLKMQRKRLVCSKGWTKDQRWRCHLHHQPRGRSSFKVGESWKATTTPSYLLPTSLTSTYVASLTHLPPPRAPVPSPLGWRTWVVCGTCIRPETGVLRGRREERPTIHSNMEPSSALEAAPIQINQRNVAHGDVDV